VTRPLASDLSAARPAAQSAKAASIFSAAASTSRLGSLETLQGDKEDGHGAEGKLSREQLLTDPDDAARFVDQTGATAASSRHVSPAEACALHRLSRE
jgi:fructose-bisphosphate aldolase class II